MVRVTGTVNCSGGRRPSHVKVRVTGQLAPAWRRRGPRNHSSFSRAAGPHVLYELLLLPGPGPGHAGHRAVMDAMPGQPETNRCPAGPPHWSPGPGPGPPGRRRRPVARLRAVTVAVPLTVRAVTVPRAAGGPAASPWRRLSSDSEVHRPAGRPGARSRRLSHGRLALALAKPGTEVRVTVPSPTRRRESRPRSRSFQAVPVST